MNLCNPSEQSILSALRRNPGPGGSISAQELGALIGRDPRFARAIVSHLRQNHRLPICSTPNEGYFWPRSKAEAEHTLAQLGSRLVEIKLTVGGIEAGLEQVFGQQELFA